MKQMVCELCDGHDFVKQDGMFVCQGCGAKYSVEEARQLMVEVEGGPAPTAAPAPAAAPGNPQMVENFITMAQNAYDANNLKEAEEYANKAIELDPTSYRAWLIKGKAAGWQSTVKNSRLPESIQAFANAIHNAPADVVDQVAAETGDQVKRISVALVSLRGDRFAKWPDKEESDGFIQDITAILNCLTQYIRSCGRIAVDLQELMAPVATIINQSVVKAWKDVIQPEYKGDDGHPNKNQFSKFIDRIGYCTTLVEQAINLCDEDDEADIQRYENLIFLHEQAIDSCSWDYDFTEYGKRWHVDYTLTDEAKRIRRGKIEEYKAKIAALKRAAQEKKDAEQRARNEAYWAEHAADKAALENERAELQKQAAAMEKELETLPEQRAVAEADQKVKALESEKASLGMFKMKEKKDLQVLIDAAVQVRQEAQRKLDVARNAIMARLTPVKDRINAIDTELTKNR